METYFKPLNGDGIFIKYPRGDFNPILGQTEPGQWYIVENDTYPTGSSNYYIIEELPINLTNESSSLIPNNPYFKKAIRSWSQTRKSQAEIDALIDTREEGLEYELLKRVVAKLVKSDDIILTGLYHTISASSLSVSMKQNASASIAERKSINDTIYNAIQSLQSSSLDLKTRTANGEDVNI